MTERAGWGILGTGGIARIFAAAVQDSSAGRLAAVGSRDPALGSMRVLDRWRAEVGVSFDPAIERPSAP